jgi:ubiquitin-protein ligase
MHLFVLLMQILLGIQELLENPNLKSAAQVRYTVSCLSHLTQLLCDNPGGLQRKAYDSYNTNKNQYIE